MKPETERWVTLYKEDRHMADTALRDGVHRQCVHHSQQMVEKVLKATWIESELTGHPPPSHNLLRLARELGISIDDETGEFLGDLAAQYQPPRYGDVMVDYSREKAEHYYRKAVQVCQQLLARLS